MRRLLLALLLFSIAALPARAADGPSLRIWTANDRGVPDLRPGGRVNVVIELRSEESYTAFAQHLTPSGLILESATASAGTLATTPFVSWTGEVSATQPVNIVLTYRVLADAPPGDRVVSAQAQVNGALLTADTRIRVCCLPAAAPAWRVYLPLIAVEHTPLRSVLLLPVLRA